MEFNKSLLLILSLSSLLLSCNAVPSTFFYDSKITLHPQTQAESKTIPDPEVDTKITLPPQAAPSPAPTAILVDSVGTGPLDHVKAAVLEQKSDPVLSNLCKDAENITLCIDTIAPTVHGHVDPVQAVEVEVDALQKQMQKNVDIILKLITDNKASNNKNLAGTLDVCKENYQGNLEDIKSAVEAIKAVDIGKAQSMLSGVISSLETCKDTFGESGLEFPLPDDSNAGYQLAGNSLGILNLIHL